MVGSQVPVWRDGRGLRWQEPSQCHNATVRTDAMPQRDGQDRARPGQCRPGATEHRALAYPSGLGAVTWTRSTAWPWGGATVVTGVRWNVALIVLR